MITENTKHLPLFYTHVIGSLPRPKVLLDLLAPKREMSRDRFRCAMDDMVLFAIRLQEQAGLDVVSDGEWRRVHYIGEFLHRIGGFEKVRKFRYRGEDNLTNVVVRRIQTSEPVFGEDAQFLVENTDRVTKFTLPSPFLIATRYWHEDYSRDAYPSRRHFIDHLAEVLLREGKNLVEVGIDIIQVDDPALTYFCDERVMRGDTCDERLLQEWNIDEQLPIAVDTINAIVEGLDAETHLHCCHSVYKRQSDVDGNYKQILPRLAALHIDRINLEFAYRNTGEITDLKLLPDHLGVGMGVIDIRSEHLQTVEEIEAIGAAGAALINPDRISLNPDCGFAPDAEEPPTIDEAFVKLRRMCTAAHRLRKRFSL